MVLRNPAAHRQSVAAILFLALGAALGGDEQAICVVAALSTMILAWRPSLRITAEGVTVTNVVRSWRLRWDDVTDVDLRGYYRGRSLTFDRASGKPVRCLAVDAAFSRDRPRVVDITRQVAATWESATGRRSTALALSRLGLAP